MKDKLKIAILEAEHWHAPLYFSTIKESGVEVVAISSSVDIIRKNVGEIFQCRTYISPFELIDKEEIGFAFAFGTHRDMPSIAKGLIARQIPFAIEKPAGLNALQVKELFDQANMANLYVAVPLVFRYGGIIEEVLKFNKGKRNFTYLNLRFVAGSPLRYIKANCSWMLNPEISGGGCTINLSHHFIDFSLQLIDSPVKNVCAAMGNLTYGMNIEDTSTTIIEFENGALSVVETGYLFPEKSGMSRQVAYAFASPDSYIMINDNYFRGITREGHVEDKTIDVDTDHWYPLFVREVVKDVTAVKGCTPKAGLKDLYRIMQIIDAAYTSGKTGKKQMFGSNSRNAKVLL